MNEGRGKEQIIQQALLLDTAERTRFLAQIDDLDLKQYVAFLLDDEKALTQFLFETGVGDSALVSEARELQPGTEVSRVKIESLIGKGGMGTVYRGFDQKLKRHVAVKSIRPEYLQNPSTRSRFIQEAQILSQINHPSICHLYDYIETEWGDYLILEYIDGTVLSEAQLSPSEQHVILMELCEALQAAHEQGIVHRDLKPDNVMISHEGRLKVLDFGIAQSIGGEVVDTQTPELSHRKDQALVGTVRYMSPEQANGDFVGTAGDMYSFGILMQELITGQPAYDMVDPVQLLTKVQQAESLAVPDTPMGALIKSLTRLDPGQRPSAAAALKTLKALQSQSQRRKKRVHAALLVLALFALVGLLLGLYVQNQRQESATLAEQGYRQQIQQTKEARQQVYLLPIHPVQEELAQLDQIDFKIEQAIGGDDRLSMPQKQRLIGQLQLQKGNHQLAVDALMAGGAGPHDLARAWQGLYLEKIYEYRYSQGGVDGSEAESIRNQYLKPTLHHIQQIKNKDPVLAAFEVLQQGDVTAAIKQLDAVLAVQNWNHDAVTLKAMALEELVNDAAKEGNWQDSEQRLERVVQTYQSAIDRARSFPKYYLRQCFSRKELHNQAVHHNGAKVQAQADAAIKVCEQLLILDPKAHKAMTALSDIHMMQAQWEIMNGLSARGSLEQAHEWIDRSIAIDDNTQNLWSGALIDTLVAQQMLIDGDDPSERLQTTFETFKLLLDRNTESKPFIASDHLYALNLMLEWQIGQGLSFVETKQAAEQIHQMVIDTPGLAKAELLPVLVNMGIIRINEFLSAVDRGNDLSALGEALIAYHRHAFEVLGNEPNVLMNLAQALQLMAIHSGLGEVEQTAHLDEALKHIDQADSLYPNNHRITLIKAQILAAQAKMNVDKIGLALNLFAQANQLNPKDMETIHDWLLLQMFDYTLTPEGQREPKRIKIKALLQRGLDLAPNDPKIQALAQQVSEWSSSR